MPIPKVPKVVCTLCGKEVSRRSTLSLEVLGGGTGRACRSHERIAALVAQFSENTRTARSAREAEHLFRIMSAAASVRVICTLYGLPPEFVYQRLHSVYRDDDTLRAIAEEVTRCGGPIMTTREISESVMSAVWLSQKRDELGLPPGMP